MYMFLRKLEKSTITTISQGDFEDLDKLFQLSHTVHKMEQNGYFKNIFWINDESYLLPLKAETITKQFENIRQGFICAVLKKFKFVFVVFWAFKRVGNRQ